MTFANQVEGLLLAAGESRRMGYPKPLIEIGGVTFLAKSAKAMLEVAERLIVVLGAYRERIAAAVPDDARIVTAYNPGFARGQLSSLKIGLAQVGQAAEAVMVHLADHPLVSPTTFCAVAAAYERSRMPIVIARCHGRRGHPVLFDRSIFKELMEAPEDQGARVVVNREPSRVGYVDVEDEGTVLDLDTPEDLMKVGLRLPAGASPG
jgi:molybdenum cofactor cytidylyltransferase